MKRSTREAQARRLASRADTLLLTRNHESVQLRCKGEITDGTAGQGGANLYTSIDLVGTERPLPGDLLKTSTHTYVIVEIVGEDHGVWEVTLGDPMLREDLAAAPPYVLFPIAVRGELEFDINDPDPTVRYEGYTAYRYRKSEGTWSPIQFTSRGVNRVILMELDTVLHEVELTYYDERSIPRKAVVLKGTPL